MRRACSITMILATLVALATGSARAGGFNLAWGSGCYAENPVVNRTFGCDTGTLRDATIVGSFQIDRAMSDFVGIEAVIDVQSDSPALPPWWDFFNSGACRQASLSASADFTSAPGSSCTDAFAGRAGGGIAAYQTAGTVPGVPSGLANAARLKLAYAVPEPFAIQGGVEYYGFRIRIDAQRTIGSGTCGGCNAAVTLVVNDITVAGMGGGVEHETSGLQSPCVTWQGTDATCAADQSRAHNASWGRVKSFYR